MLGCWGVVFKAVESFHDELASGLKVSSLLFQFSFVYASMACFTFTCFPFASRFSWGSRVILALFSNLFFSLSEILFQEKEIKIFVGKYLVNDC